MEITFRANDEPNAREKIFYVSLKNTALPAMRELRQELTGKYNLSVEINTLFEQEEPALELVIHKESMRDFMYGIKSVGREVSEQLINDENLPHIQHSVTYEPYTYFFLMDESVTMFNIWIKMN